jgi:hypothetical protein
MIIYIYINLVRLCAANSLWPFFVMCEWGQSHPHHRTGTVVSTSSTTKKNNNTTSSSTIAQACCNCAFGFLPLGYLYWWRWGIYINPSFTKHEMLWMHTASSLLMMNKLYRLSLSLSLIYLLHLWCKCGSDCVVQLLLFSFALSCCNHILIIDSIHTVLGIISSTNEQYTAS